MSISDVTDLLISPGSSGAKASINSSRSCSSLPHTIHMRPIASASALNVLSLADCRVGFLGMTKKPDAEEQYQSDSDGWARFERAVDAAVKSGPKHKVSAPPVNKKERPASKGRVHKGRTKA